MALSKISSRLLNKDSREGHNGHEGRTEVDALPIAIEPLVTVVRVPFFRLARISSNW